jgi:ABC-2 type transporter
MTGWRTLFYKEVMRFWSVGFQTVAAPVLTAMLYMLIFGHVLDSGVKVYGTVGYTAFLVPGLVMMSVLQNAFANSSSSLIQSKIMGNLVFVLLTPELVFCLRRLICRTWIGGWGRCYGGDVLVWAAWYRGSDVDRGVCYFGCCHAGCYGIDRGSMG